MDIWWETKNPFKSPCGLQLPWHSLEGDHNSIPIVWRFLEGLGQDTGLYNTADRSINNGGAQMYLLLSKKEEMDMDVKISVSISCWDHGVVRGSHLQGEGEE